MTITRTLFLLPAVLFAFVLAPASALAACSGTNPTTCTTVASPQGGVDFFYGTDNELWDSGLYVPAIYSAFSGNYNGSPVPSQSQMTNAGISGRGSAGNYNDETLIPLCNAADAALGAGAVATGAIHGSDEYSSCDNNSLITFNKNGSGKWERGGGCYQGGWHLDRLTCTSLALPQPVFTASSYAITAGQSVTLTWNDTVLRDYMAGYSVDDGNIITPNAESVVGGDQSVGPGGTIAPPPFASCTSVGWDNTGLTGGYFESGVITSSNCADYGESSYDCEYTSYAWVPDATTRGERKSGTVTVSPQVTTTYKYICTNPNGTTEKQITIAVSGGTPKPDLVADAVSPTTATQGTAKTFSSLISNSGTASTGASFTVLFQRATDINGTGSTDISTQTVTTLAAGDSATASLSYTFASSGTYFMRVCADKASAAGAGSIAEFDETNNCGPWTSVLVASTIPLPDYTVMLAPTFTPASVVTGSTMLFSGKVKNSGNTAATTSSQMKVQIDTGAAGSAYKASATTLTTTATAIPALGAGAQSGSTEVNSAWVPTTVGTYKARACADSANTIGESNENNNCGPDVEFTVENGTADLTAGAITPTTAVQNTSKTYQVPISNIGTAGTGIGFSTLFQRASDAAGTGAVDVGTGSVGVINGGASATASFSYTYSGSGTIYLRACADKNAMGDPGVIVESDENNNCGAWTAVIVSAASSGPSVSCTPSASSINPGGSVTYTAATSGFGGGIIRYTWTNANGTPSSQGPNTNTSFTTTYANEGSYAANVVATKTSFPTNITASADCSPVTVANACGSTPQPTISSSASRVLAGDTVTLRWSATGVNNSCVVSGPNIAGGTKTSVATSCNVSDGGGATATINTQSTYCIVCDGNTAAQECVTVDVAPKIIEF